MTQSTAAQSALLATIDDVSPDEDGADLASLVTDDGRIMTIPLDLLPEGSSPGDVLNIAFTADPKETDARKARVANLQHKLFG